MSETCEVCGQFTGQTASFDLWIRGLDRRGEGDRIEMTFQAFLSVNVAD